MWLIILIIIVGLVYFASMQGITCCNSGSSFALVKAIVKKKKLSINEFIKYTKYMDYSKVKDKYYTDRPPGTAFAAVPIYFFGGNVTIIPVISGILSTILIYLITMQLVNKPVIALFTGLIFAFCTTSWRYSTIFIIHSLSTFLVFLSVYFLLLGYPTVLIGTILGIATIIEYTNFTFLFGMSLAETICGNFHLVPILVIGYCVGIIPLLIYNAKCFGSPFTTSYKYSAYFKWSNSFRTTFVTPILKGVKGLLFFVKTKDGIKLPGGVLTMSPILIFGIIGYFYLPLQFLILFLCLSLPLFLLMSKHKTYWGGGAGDYRYISSIIPYITIPIGLSMKNLSFLWPVMLLLALFSLFIVAARMIALTVSIEDLKKINPQLKIKGKKKISKFLNFRYFGRFLALTFEGLFIRKIHLEKRTYKEKDN